MKSAGKSGGNYPGQNIATFGIGIDQSIERFVQAFGLLIAESTVFAMEVPPADQRPGPQGSQHRQLGFGRRHFRVQPHAIRGPGRFQDGGEFGCQEFRVPHLDRDDRSACSI